MPKTAYIEKRFRRSTLKIIDMANDIIDEYVQDNLKLTLRQLYYQFVSRDLIRNKDSEYKRLGGIISDARMAGLIDWYSIEDRTRNLMGNTHWTDPGHIIGAVARSFRLDHWEGQDFHPEVWIEKEALVGVISRICQDLDVNHFACKGYVSLSEMWSAAQRLIYHSQRKDQIPVIIHLGDHDPSGIDMTRDIEDRQGMFAGLEGVYVKVVRIALNMDQIEVYSPPPNPAKVTDSRYKKYIKRFGGKSWELDALEPKVLRGLIEREVLKYRDQDIYNRIKRREKRYLKILKKVKRNWRDL